MKKRFKSVRDLQKKKDESIECLQKLIIYDARCEYVRISRYMSYETLRSCQILIYSVRFLKLDEAFSSTSKLKSLKKWFRNSFLSKYLVTSQPGLIEFMAQELEDEDIPEEIVERGEVDPVEDSSQIPAIGTSFSQFKKGSNLLKLVMIKNGLKFKTATFVETFKNAENREIFLLTSFDAATLHNDSACTNDYICLINDIIVPSASDLLLFSHIDTKEELNEASERIRDDIMSVVDEYRCEDPVVNPEVENLMGDLLLLAERLSEATDGDFIDVQMKDHLNDDFYNFFTVIDLLMKFDLKDFGAGSFKLLLAADLSSQGAKILGHGCSTTYACGDLGKISSDFVHEIFNNVNYRSTPLKKYFIHMNLNLL